MCVIGIQKNKKTLENVAWGGNQKNMLLNPMKYWGFWAPQIFKKDGLYYMFYTANEKITVAFSESPLGPFINQKKNYFKAKGRQIDPFVFSDGDKYFLY